MTSKNWTFALNNSTDEEQADIKDIDCQYIIFGKEDDSSNIQGYVQFKNNRCIHYVQSRSGLERAEIYRTTGTPSQETEYCEMAGSYTFTKGDMIQG
jgi:hypothetical protein